MADKTLTALTATTALVDADTLYVIDGVNSRKITFADFDASLITKGSFASAAQGATADSALQDITGEALGDLANVTEATPVDGDLMVYVTDHWENQTLAEAGVVDAADITTLDDTGASDGHLLGRASSVPAWRSPVQARGDLTEVNAQVGTTYTTVDGDNGKIITLNNASAITVTVHAAAAAEFSCLLVQMGAGQVTVAAGGTGNIRNRQSHTKIAGQYGVASIYVDSNAGTAPEVILGGDTAA